MQIPKAGETIRITAVKSFASTNISVGQILTVAEDPRQPMSEYDGYRWVESSDGTSKGWVKWEVVEVITADEAHQIRLAIGVFATGASLSEGVTRFAAAQQKARSIHAKHMTELEKRIAVAEREVQRLSTPAGSAYTYRVDGPHSEQTVKRTTQRDELHARASRQRREIRRLNQSQRTMKLESQVLRRTNEDLVEKLIDQNKMIRMLESK